VSASKQYAREALAIGYWVDADGIPQGPRGPRRCGRSTSDFLRFSVHLPGVDRRAGKRCHVLVHQLAALCIFGEKALADDVVILHLDRDRDNNTPANLALGTRSDAQMLIPRHERHLYAMNAAMKRRSLTPSQVVELRAMRAAGATLKELASAFEVAKSTVSYVVNGKTYA